MGIWVVVGNFLNGVGRTDITFKLSLLRFLIAVPLVFVLTMFYGVLGLIVSMVISSFLPLICGLGIVVWRFGMRFDVRSVLKIYLASFISAGLSFFAGSYFSLFGYLVDLFLTFAVFLFSYLVLVPVVGAVGVGDLNNLRGIFGRFRLLAPFVNFLLRFEFWVLKLCGSRS